MPELLIRRAALADADVLADLGRRTFVETFGHLYPAQDLTDFLRDAYGPARTLRDLGDPAKAAWLAEIDGTAIGYALAGPCDLPHAEVTPTCGELKRLYLLAAHQGAGVGERLFRTALDWLAETREGDTWIGVWSQNHGAQRFYRRHGFTVAGRYAFPVGRTLDQELILRRGRHNHAVHANGQA